MLRSEKLCLRRLQQKHPPVWGFQLQHVGPLAVVCGSDGQSVVDPHCVLQVHLGNVCIGLVLILERGGERRAWIISPTNFISGFLPAEGDTRTHNRVNTLVFFLKPHRHMHSDCGCTQEEDVWTQSAPFVFLKCLPCRLQVSCMALLGCNQLLIYTLTMRG